MARPTKLTPEVHARITKAVRAGSHFKTAAESAGVSEATFHRWIRTGSEAKAGIQHDLYEDVKRAAAELEVELAARIGKAAAEEWADGGLAGLGPISHSRFLAESLPRANIEELAGHGHLPTAEVLSRIVEHLASTGQ